MSHSRRLAGVGLTIFTSIAVAGLTATPAQAASSGVASVVGSKVVQFKAGAGKTNRVVITRSGKTITIDDTVALKPGKGCKKVNKTKVKCTTKSAPTGVRVYLGARNDSVTNRSGVALTAYGSSGNDRLVGGSAADYLSGQSGKDSIWGGAGNDRIEAGSAADSVRGESGNDRINSGTGADWIAGGTGNDSINASDGNDAVYGEAGDDKVWGGDGNDRIYLGDGADFGIGEDAYQTSGHDLIEGGAGNDNLNGGGIAVDGERIADFGNDTLRGGDGNDNIEGFQGNDRIEGGAGNDHLAGDFTNFDPAQPHVGADVILGGSGVDSVTYSARRQPVTVDLDGAARDDGQAGEYDTVGADVEDLSGGWSNDVLTGNAAANGIYGVLGNDVIRGGAGNDDLWGGQDGNDQVYGEDGDDRINTETDSGRGPDRADGGANTDTCKADATDTVTNCEA
ncbi:calcium-binding protein [Actinoplanes sp. NPDC024001]|uniref:calcium-binding protein n=1 Tax=Actinoplanes sp. NPDC024001 TaxID=3154598 RepID=UPI0033F155D4